MCTLRRKTVPGTSPVTRERSSPWTHNRPEENRRGSEDGSVKSHKSSSTAGKQRPPCFSPRCHVLFPHLTHVGCDSFIWYATVGIECQLFTGRVFGWRRQWFWQGMLPHAITSVVSEHEVREQRRQRALCLHCSLHSERFPLATLEIVFTEFLSNRKRV